MKTLISLALSGGLFLGAVSLGTGCRTDTAGTVVLTDHLGGDTDVLEDSTRLHRRLEVTDLKYDTLANGVKRVHITVANRSHKRLRVHYRIAWFDDSGMEIDPDTKTYRSLIIEGKDSVTVTGVANNLAATTSRLRVREAKVAE